MYMDTTLRLKIRTFLFLKNREFWYFTMFCFYRYSAMNATEKVQALEAWESKWDKFIESFKL